MNIAVICALLFFAVIIVHKSLYKGYSFASLRVASRENGIVSIKRVGAKMGKSRRCREAGTAHALGGWIG